MIPICMRESVTFKDGDGIVWKFKPKTGALEYEQMQAGVEAQKFFDAGDIVGGVERHKFFFDSVLLGWSEEGGRMPKFPESKKPSSVFNSEERMQILEMWGKASALDPVEKKS